MTARRPLMVVVAGPNGSGKTTLTRLVLAHEWLRGTAYINPDEIAQRELGGWNDVEHVLQAARLADERRALYLSRGENFAYETVFSTPGRVSFIEQAKSAGYFIRLYFVGTSDPLINIARVKARVAEGGHDVPTDKIVARYHRSMANLKLVLPIVDRAYIYDNSIENKPAIRWARLRDGHLIRAHEIPMPSWVAEALTAALEPPRAT